jgi:hypothetical protein
MPSFAQRAASQVPGEETLDGHHQAIPIGGHGLEEGFRRRLHIAVEQDFSFVTQDADVHGAGMPVDAAVKLVRCGVKSPEVSSS